MSRSFSMRDSNAARISCRFLPATARMKGNPNFSLVSVVQLLEARNSSGVQRSSPAPACSERDEAVRSAIAEPAGEVGMVADQLELCRLVEGGRDLGHRGRRPSACRSQASGRCRRRASQSRENARRRRRISRRRRADPCSAAAGSNRLAFRFRAYSSPIAAAECRREPLPETGAQRHYG